MIQSNIQKSSSKKLFSPKLKHVLKHPSSGGVDLRVLFVLHVRIFYIRENLLKSNQEEIYQKSWNLCGIIFRWCRFKFVPFMMTGDVYPITRFIVGRLEQVRGGIYTACFRRFLVEMVKCKRRFRIKKMS